MLRFEVYLVDVGSCERDDGWLESEEDIREIIYGINLEMLGGKLELIGFISVVWNERGLLAFCSEAGESGRRFDGWELIRGGGSGCFDS